MSRFSEAEFSAAMERAVEKRGADWCYPTDRSTPGFFYKGVPTYADESGAATCLVGAAMHELRMQLPIGAAGSAVAVLRDFLPIHVQVAARCAQIHQDIGKPWGESLNVYRAALTLARRRDSVDALYGVNTLYYESVAVVRGRSSADQAMKALADAAQVATEAFEAFSFEPEEVTIMSASGEKVIQSFYGGSGGWCAPSEALAHWGATPYALTINLPSVSKQAFSIMSGGPFKHEHALTA
jgi:hypothetical protein